MVKNIPMELRKLLVLTTILLAACTAEPIQPNSSATKSTPTPVEQPATMDEWNAALYDILVEESAEDKGGGVTEFLACFRTPEGVSCGTNWGRRDAFKRVRFFSTGLRGSIGSVITAPYLKSYISLPDGKLPIIFLSPVYTGDSWIFMNEVAVMVDGQVVLEKDLDNLSVRRESGVDYVDESYQFSLSEDELKEFRNITRDSNVLIRLTGERGYVMVDPADVDFIKQDIADLIHIYDLLTAALKDHIPPSPSDSTQSPLP